jgi:2-polyprenyl-6-methoxyphenol hydroxylase and related FAD-dependent oxidoreductases
MIKLLLLDMRRPQRVIVTTEDGIQHHGHILIGADGIHSRVRKLMADKNSVTNPSLAKDINEGLCNPSLRAMGAE